MGAKASLKLIRLLDNLDAKKKSHNDFSMKLANYSKEIIDLEEVAKAYLAYDFKTGNCNYEELMEHIEDFKIKHELSDDEDDVTVLVYCFNNYLETFLNNYEKTYEMMHNIFSKVIGSGYVLQDDDIDAFSDSIQLWIDLINVGLDFICFAIVANEFKYNNSITGKNPNKGKKYLEEQGIYMEYFNNPNNLLEVIYNIIRLLQIVDDCVGYADLGKMKAFEILNNFFGN